MIGIDKVLMLAKLALDAASMRHATIANNIANAATPGYQPLQVNFEQQLTALGATSTAPISKSTLAGVQPFVEPAPVSDKSGAAVMVDMEMVKLAQNTLLYQAILGGLGKKLGVLSAVINGGKR
jgi:flagellar basal-body rod protein FlgB